VTLLRQHPTRLLPLLRRKHINRPQLSLNRLTFKIIDFLRQQRPLLRPLLLRIFLILIKALILQLKQLLQIPNRRTDIILLLSLQFILHLLKLLHKVLLLHLLYYDLILVTQSSCLQFSFVLIYLIHLFCPNSRTANSIGAVRFEEFLSLFFSRGAQHYCHLLLLESLLY